MSVLGNAGALSTGEKVLLATGVAGTGVNASYNFTVQPTPDGRARTLVLITQAATLPTTMTVGLYASADNGATWSIYAASIALVATTASTAQIVANVAAGLLYQLNVTAWTAGSASAVGIYGIIG